LRACVGLEPYIIGQTICRVQVTKPKLVSGKGTKRTENQAKVDEFINGLTNQKIIKIDRVSKNLIIEMESGRIMLVHLKMTGQLVYQPNLGDSVYGGHPIENSQGLPSKHSHIVMELDEGVLYYNDTRMFGYVLYYPNYEAMQLEHDWSNLGQDPALETFDKVQFVQEFGKLSGIIKKNFLDGRVVVGLGNIYADEVCFDVGIRPMRTNKSLTKKELGRVYDSIVKIIPLAIANNGSSIANYLLADGSRGNYANYHKVYNRGGKPCLVCERVLKSIKLAGRTTVFCLGCQG
jgi:formamidopyrimidine-DNA glycosylase